MSEAQQRWPSDWSVRSLEKIASLITSGGTPTSGNPRFYLEYGGLPFAKTEDLTRAKSRFIEECELGISEVALKESAAKKYPAGTVLISMYGTIGLTKIAGIEMAANQALCALIPPLACDSGYLYHHLEYTRPGWLKYSGQTTQANINGATVRAHEVPLPDPSEQRKISQVLDTLDTAIHETEAIIAKLKAVKQGLLHDLLTRGIDANGELRPPQAEAPHLYKQSPLGWIPKTWGLKSLGQILAEPTKNGLYKPSQFHGRGPLMVQMGGLFAGDAATFDTATRVQVTPFEFNIFGLSNGDLLFARRSLVFEGAGQCVIVRNLAEPSTFESSIVRVRVRLEEAHPEFVFQFLRGHRSNAQRRKLIRQVAVSGVSGADIRELLVALPPLEEQSWIVERQLEVQTRIDLELASAAKLRNQKAGLMDDLLTGRVRVTPLLEATP